MRAARLNAAVAVLAACLSGLCSFSGVLVGETISGERVAESRPITVYIETSLVFLNRIEFSGHERISPILSAVLKWHLHPFLPFS